MEVRLWHEAHALLRRWHVDVRSRMSAYNDVHWCPRGQPDTRAVSIISPRWELDTTQIQQFLKAAENIMSRGCVFKFLRWLQFRGGCTLLTCPMPIVTHWHSARHSGCEWSRGTLHTVQCILHLFSIGIKSLP